MLRRTCGSFLAANWRAVPEKIHYDLCIIGGGPAGIAAALRAVDFKKKVCLIEKGPLGGCDLWNGALQSKTMWELAVFLQKLGGPPSQRLFGESLGSYFELDEEKMRHSMQVVSETREQQIRQALSATNVDLLVGQATFQSNNEVQCHNHDEMSYQNVTADYFIIATGSSPREHPFVAVDKKLVVTSNEVMHQPLPRSLVIIGAGVIGCEFASILSGLGKTKVALIDKAPRILSGEDGDIVDLVERQMEDNGVHIHHNSTLYDLQAWEEDDAEALSAHPDQPDLRRSGVQYTIMNRHSKKLTTYNVDRALLAIGRTPNYRNLGLENTTLRTWDGRLTVNEVGLCKGSQSVFAVGDAASTMPLVTMGEAQAKLAVDYMYSTCRRDAVVSATSMARSMTSVAFLTKAVASVGMNETQCRKDNIAYICCVYGFGLVSRAVAAANTDGFIKIIVSNDAEMRVLGVRAVGMNASTMVDLGSLAIQKRQSAFDLADRLTAYPAVSQAFQECLRAILGRAELKPGTFPSLVVTKWRPASFERGVVYQQEARAELLAKGIMPRDTEGETVCVVNRRQDQRAPSGASGAAKETGVPAATSSAASASSTTARHSTPSTPTAASSTPAGPSQQAVDTHIEPGFFFRPPAKKH